MTDDRWQRVQVPFQAAVERSLADRTSFIAAAADRDEELRKSV